MDFNENLNQNDEQINNIIIDKLLSLDLSLPKKDFCNKIDKIMGQRYDIPMLVSYDPLFKEKYLDYMILSIKRPDEFHNIISWN